MNQTPLWGILVKNKLGTFERKLSLKKNQMKRMREKWVFTPLVPKAALKTAHSNPLVPQRHSVNASMTFAKYRSSFWAIIFRQFIVVPKNFQNHERTTKFCRKT